MMKRQGSRIIAALAVFCALLLVATMYFFSHRTIPGADELLSISCPDLGKADGFLFQTEQGAALIDTGEDTDARTLLELMRRKHISELDALILTHYDKDHIGGAAAILAELPVKTVYLTDFSNDSASYTALMDALSSSDAQTVTVTEPYAFQLDKVSFTLYPPMEQHYSKNEDNNASVITTVSAGDSHLLFMGDAQKDRVTEFLENQYDGTQYNFLKVPHHGQDTKTLERMLSYFTPSDALITSSDAEPEDNDLLSSLTDADCNIWLTRSGIVTVTCTTDGMQVLQ